MYDSNSFLLLSSKLISFLLCKNRSFIVDIEVEGFDFAFKTHNFPSRIVVVVVFVSSSLFIFPFVLLCFSCPRRPWMGLVEGNVFQFLYTSANLMLPLLLLLLLLATANNLARDVKEKMRSNSRKNNQTIIKVNKIRFVFCSFRLLAPSFRWHSYMFNLSLSQCAYLLHKYVASTRIHGTYWKKY